MPYVLDTNCATVGDFGAVACPPGSYKNWKTGVCTPCDPGMKPNTRYPAHSSVPCVAIPGYVTPPPPLPPQPGLVVTPESLIIPGLNVSTTSEPATVPTNALVSAVDNRPWYSKHKVLLAGGAAALVLVGALFAVSRMKTVSIAPVPELVEE